MIIFSNEAITVKAISPFSWGGAGNGCTYRFEVTVGNLTTLCASERDVAYNFRRLGVPLPEQLAGPYDGYGRKEA